MADSNLTNSTITSDLGRIVANDSSTSNITVQLKDDANQNITEGGETVVINTTKGTISSVTDNNDGTYTAVLTPGSIDETATLSFTVNGTVATNTTIVSFYSLTCEHSFATKLNFFEAPTDIFDVPMPPELKNIIRTQVFDDYTYVLTNGYLAKINEEGLIVWVVESKATILPESTTVYFYDFVIDTIGDLLILGSTNLEEEDLLHIIKCNSDAEISWVKQYQENQLSSVRNIDINSISSFGNGNFLITNSDKLLLIDSTGTVLKNVNTGLGSSIIISSSLNYVGIIEKTLSQVIVFDINLNVIFTREFTSSLSGANLLISTNNLIISSTTNNTTTFFKISLLNKETSVTTKSYKEISNTSLSSVKTESENLKGNEAFIYGYGTTGDYPILYKFDINFNLLWSKVIKLNSTNGIVGLNVNKGCLTFTFKFDIVGDLPEGGFSEGDFSEGGFSEGDFSDVPTNDYIEGEELLEYLELGDTGWLIHSDLDLNVDIDCVTIEDLPLITPTTGSIEFSEANVVINEENSTSSNVDANFLFTTGSEESICPPVLDLNLSTIEASDTTIDANGESVSEITVSLLNNDGSVYDNYAEVVIQTDAGEISLTQVNYDGTYSAILTSSTIAETATLSFTVDGEQASQTAEVIFKATQCPAHIAFLIDESGSISTSGANEIQESLNSFIELQDGGNMTISLIGMSSSDTNTRTDHVLEQKVDSSTKGQFTTWVNNFRNGGASTQSHYWASGLTVIDGLSSTPDIIIIIADGAATNSSQVLLEAVKKANNKSHVFVYALGSGLYHNGINFTTRTIEDTLGYYMNRSPISIESSNNILITDYQKGINDFTALGSALLALNDHLIQAEVGCGNIAITETNFEEITFLSQQVIEDLEIGTITLKNDKSYEHIVEKGTQLIKANGLIAVAASTVIIARGEKGVVPVILSGTACKNGKHEEVISVAGVLNPNELVITILIKRLPEVKYTQSPFLYLQAAGSTGEDGSAKGVHLRWIFKNKLGDNHLPKGNLASNTDGYNKPDDFVKICKIPYEKKQITLNFASACPASRGFDYRPERRQPFLTYEVEGSRFKVYFVNVNQFNSSARSIDPEIHPKEFLESYNANSGNIIEIETVYSLAFSVEFIVENSLPNSSLETEFIGSEDKLLEKSTGLVVRKTYNSGQLSNTYQSAEDIKKVKFRANNCLVTSIKFELYSTVVKKADDENLWQELGDYALTTNDATAFKYLEPETGLVDGKWPRYNEGDLVNIENYQKKWGEESSDEFDKNLKQIVTDYIKLSNDQSNPGGIETISFGEDDDDPQDISHIDVLYIASIDYHMARMLGLGCFDLDTKTETQKFMYAIKYTTKNKIDGYKYDDDTYEVDHIYTSLPTSVEDQRLPLPFTMDKIVPGVPSSNPFETYEDAHGNITVAPTMTLADKEGYSPTGKTRFVSLFATEIPEDEILIDFYEKTKQFNSSDYTVPVNGGVEVKISEETGWSPSNGPWDKPEVSVTDEYFNKTETGDVTQEIIPLSIPENGYPLYVHKQTQEGFYTYGSYGINWFGRVTPTTKTIEIETKFIPNNNLLPPHNINALHIVEERPLILTSAMEQELLGEIPTAKKDKTLVRVAFDYNSIEELVSYKITDRLEAEAQEKLKDELAAGENVLLHSEAIFKDEKEIFADEIEIFFRNEIPQNIRGEIISITDHPTNNLISVITTSNYVLNSSADQENTDEEPEIIRSEFPTGTRSTNFEGGIFTTNGNNFFIESIKEGTRGVIINVYKKHTADNVQTEIIPQDNVALESPEIESTSDKLFMAVENMSAPVSWNNNVNNRFAVKIGTGDNSNIHREVIIKKNGPDDGPETVLQKTRGFWGNSKITPIEQVINIVNEEEVYGHKGLYAIELPFKLAKHPQNTPDALGNFVEWYGGIVRVHTQEYPEGPRKNLKVIRIENTGSTTENVVVYVLDEAFQVGFEGEDVTIIDTNTNEEFIEFVATLDANGNEIPKVIPPSDAIIQGTDVEVNFYPGYKAYLYADSDFNLTENSITPTSVDLKYSVFGLRSKDLATEALYGENYTSPVSAPALMFVHKIIDPLAPEQPLGSLYATQPDSFGKATYALTTKFKHKPYGIMYYRSNDRSILGAMYTHTTVAEIMEKLESYDPDTFYANRWDELLSFDYDNDEFDEVSGYRFPKPDKTAFLNLMNDDIEDYNRTYKKSVPLINANTFNLNTSVIPENNIGIPAKTVTDYVRIAIMNSFVPLTEAPLLYDHMAGDNYQPIAKRQVLRDRDGNLLAPTNSLYDNAPMAKRLSVSGKTYDDILFTDFGLDGTSKNTYFYTAREVGSTTQLGDFSTVKGPVKLVNTKEPENPQIKRVLPILASSQFEFVQVPLEFVDIENIEIGENNKLIKTTDGDANAGVASKQILRGNTYTTFKAEVGTNAKIGFSSFNMSSGYETIQFALGLNENGSLTIFQSGEDLGEVGTYTDESIFKIEIKGLTIIFSRDEVILYTETLLKASDFVLDVTIESNDASLYDIELFSIAPSYTKEELTGEVIPLTTVIATKALLVENVEITDTKISKYAGLNGDQWDAGAYFDQYMPSYGSVSYKVKANTSVMVGLADETLNQSEAIETIDYALQNSEDGYLYVCINGNRITDKCVQYDENSLLEIERRNNFLIFKKDQRPFYELALASNIPLFIDFSMYTGNSEIINLEMKTTKELVKDIPTDELNPALLFEVNAYQKDQRIRKLNLYRTTAPENTLSVRTMDLVSTVDLVLTNQLDNNILTIKDEFLDLEFVPYSDPLYYRVTVSREVEYAKANTEPPIIVSEYKPSKASKLLVSSIVESTSPQAPDMTYGFDAYTINDTIIDNIILNWNKTVHNGKYHIYNMNSQGNWVKIHELISNEEEIQLFLEETDLENILQIKDGEGTLKYHHFKVDAENSVGMLNVESKIITIPSDAGVASLEGIGSMIIEHTNLVR